MLIVVRYLPVDFLQYGKNCVTKFCCLVTSVY